MRSLGVLDSLLRKWKLQLQLQLQLLHASHSLAVSGCGWQRMDPPTALHFLFAGSEPAAVPSTPHPPSASHIRSGAAPPLVAGCHCSRQPHLTFFTLSAAPKTWTAWLLIRVQKFSKEMFWPLSTSIFCRRLSSPPPPSAACDRKQEVTRRVTGVLQGRRPPPPPLGCAAVLLAEPPVMSSMRSHLGHGGQLLGHQALELGVAQGGAVVCSLVELCDQRVDGQLQI